MNRLERIAMIVGQVVQVAMSVAWWSVYLFVMYLGVSEALC